MNMEYILKQIHILTIYRQVGKCRMKYYSPEPDNITELRYRPNYPTVRFIFCTRI